MQSSTCPAVCCIAPALGTPVRGWGSGAAAEQPLLHGHSRSCSGRCPSAFGFFHVMSPAQRKVKKGKAEMLLEPWTGDLQSRLPPWGQKKHLNRPPRVFFRPKALSCKGKEVENVFNIRTPEDANRVVKLATSKNVVIVGASFLGEHSLCRWPRLSCPRLPADGPNPSPSLSPPR